MHITSQSLIWEFNTNKKGQFSSVEKETSLHWQWMKTTTLHTLQMIMAIQSNDMTQVLADFLHFEQLHIVAACPQSNMTQF